MNTKPEEPQDATQGGEPEGTTEPEQPQGAGAVLAEAAGSGFFAGLVGGVAANYLGGGKMTFPVYLVVSLLILSGVKTWWGKTISLILFVVVATVIMHLFSGPLALDKEAP